MQLPYEAVMQPVKMLSDLVGCVIVDQDYHSDVVFKHNDGFGVMRRSAVVGEQGVQEGTKHAMTSPSKHTHRHTFTHFTYAAAALFVYPNCLVTFIPTYMYILPQLPRALAHGLSTGTPCTLYCLVILCYYISI
jgi:hypothetical protein